MRTFNITNPSEDLLYFTRKYGWKSFNYRASDRHVAFCKTLDFTTVFHCWQNKTYSEFLKKNYPSDMHYMIIPQEEHTKYNKAILQTPWGGSDGLFFYREGEWIAPTHPDYNKIKSGKLCGYFHE